jgi:5'-3' exoribonuclease 1
MGIPKFFGWFANQDIFRPTISRDRPQQVDIFAIDANSIIYNNINQQFAGSAPTRGGMIVVSQDELYRRRYEVFRGIFRDIIGLTQTIRPRRSLFIYIDGVPPQAKINQQRMRRYKAASERRPDQLFDTNQITPGTDFMRDLDAYIRQELARIAQIDVSPGQVRDPYAEALPPHIVYSSYLVPGEGEHKIADQLRNLVAQGQTVVIHGADADLLMIYLLHLRNGWENIYLFRENTQNYGIETMVNLRAVERVLRTLYPGVLDPIGDFVVIIFLIGNDFLPHFPVFERVYDALNTLIGGYYKYLQTNPGAGITTESGIHWQNFAQFLQYITVNFNDTLLRQWGENTDAQIKFPSAVAERCITQTRQIIGTQSQCIRTFDVGRFNQAWYRFVFSPKGRPPVLDPTQQDLNDIISSYLEGIAWVYGYYRYGVGDINLGWYYPYHYAPLFSDLYQYIQNAYSKGNGATWETNPLHLHSEFVTPLEQMIMVLPPKSITSVPIPLRSLYSESSPIYDMFPQSFFVDNQGKMDEWQAIALLPIPLPTRVTRAIAALNLPPEFTAQFEPIEPYVMTRDITQVFRVSGGNRRGRGGSGRGGSRGSGRGGSRGSGRGGSRGSGRGGSRGSGRGGSRGSGRGGSRGSGRGRDGRGRG